MNRFLQNFLQDAPGKLSEVRRELEILGNLSSSASEETRREGGRQHLRKIFHHIHTLKGSAAAFGIENVRELAHEFENLLEHLCFGETVYSPASLALIKAEIEKIEAALKMPFEENRQLGLPQNSSNLLRNLGLDKNQAKIEFDESYLPAKIWEKLTELEKQNLQQAAASRADIYVLAIKFFLSEFQEKLSDLRFRLEQHGEIIAALPGAAASSAEIVLQIVFATNTAGPTFLKAIESFDQEILFTGKALVSIAKVATPAFLAGRRASIELGKEVEFKMLGATEPSVTEKQASILTAALLHLVTNAVAHGIELPAERISKGKQPIGTISVTAEKTAFSITVSVCDDGRGIDFEKVAEASEKLYQARLNPAELNIEEVQKLIFAPGFSTAETLTQIAGRGVGLDAVKSVVESGGGTIKVASETGLGTTFEIVLPQT